VNREPDQIPDGLSSLERIFSPDFYLSAYPDVANSGLDPWAHFSKFGIAEGRSPNAYVDANYMANALALPLGDVLLEAFSKKEYWTENTSRYVDIRSFVLNGPWDGKTHPLEQIINTDQNRDPWIRFAPYFSDLSTTTGNSLRLAAVSILDHINGSRFHLSRPKEYRLNDNPLENMDFDVEESVLCIPGFTLSAKDKSFTLSTMKDVLSKDRSAIRHGETLTVYQYGDTLHCNSLVIAPKNLRLEEALRWVNSLKIRCAVVPTSADQEFLFRHCLSATNREDVYILPYGVQTVVVTKQVSTSPSAVNRPRRVFRRPEKLRRSTLLIVAESSAELKRYSPSVSMLVRRGAKICISNNQTVPFWLNLFSAIRVVIVCGSISWPELWIRRSVPILKIEEWE
jgi:hypothetical protein